MPENAVETPWQQPCREVVEAQRAFAFDLEVRRNERISKLYDAARKWLAKLGGAESLRAAMGEKESFISTVSKAINRIHEENGQRAVRIDWLAYGDDGDADYLLVAGINEAFGYAPPVRGLRACTQEEIDRAAREELANEKDTEKLDLHRRRIAKRLGIRIEDVRL